MPRMNILNTAEREAFNSPPVFSSFQRKQYFDFPSKLRRFAAGLRSPAWRKPASAHQELHHCWNYLYLSQKLEEIKDTASREAFLDAVAMARRLPGSTSTCSDFSDEKLARQNRNSTPKIGGLNGAPFLG
jgi:hypothetical protein